MGQWTVGARLSLLEWQVKDKQREDAMMSHISFSWYQSKIQMLNESCSPRDSQECSPTPQFKALIHCHSAFFIVQFSYMTIRETIAQSSQNFVGKEMSLHFNMLPRLVITFLSFSSKEQVYVLVQFFELSNFVGLTMPCLIQALSAVVVTGQMAL